MEITTKCFSKANRVKYTRIIRERKLLGLVETGRENVKNNGITNGVTDYESTEWSIHSQTNPVDKENRN